MTDSAIKNSDHPTWKKADGTLDAVAMTRALRAQLAEELSSIPDSEWTAWLRKRASEAFPDLYEKK
jgi:chemotaxis regulatin CheY-phosphate phosphatase CheZ